MVSSLYPPETIGGAEKYVKNVSESLVDDGHEVYVLTTGCGIGVGEGTEKVNGVTVRRISPTGFYTPYESRDAPFWQKPPQQVLERWNPSAFMEIKEFYRETNPDIVHTHNFGGLSTAAFTAASYCRLPVVHTLHDYRLLDIRYTLWHNEENVGVRRLMAPYRWFNRRIVDRPVDRVLSPSRFMLEIHQEYGFFTNVDSTCIPYGMSYSDATNVHSNKGETDSEDRLRLLFVGQLTAQKGVLWLAKSITDMRQSDIQLDILGKGPHRDELEQLAKQDERIAVHGFVTGEELDQFYRQADATVVPSKWYDNSPVVIYESYFQGTPVIGADIGGIPELIQEGQTGFLFDPYDSASLRAAIRSAIQADDEQLEAGVERVREQYTMEKHIPKLVSEYESTLA